MENDTATLEHGTGWQKEIPNEAGLWEMRCDENGQKPERIPIEARGDELWVNLPDPDLGKYPLDMYHGNLIDIRWRKVTETCDKKLYATKKAALTSQNYILKKRGRGNRALNLRVYFCDVCQGFHLTKQEKREA